MIFGTVKDIHANLAIHHVGPTGGDVDGGKPLAYLVFLDIFGNGVDHVCDLLRCRPAVLAVELDAEVLVDTTRVVGGGQNEAAEGNEATLAAADDSARRRSAHEAILTDPNCLDPVRNGHLRDDLNSFLVVVSTISADNDCATLNWHTCGLQSIEGALDEVLEIVLAHKHLCLLSQAGGARLLAIDGLCRLRRHGEIAGQRLLCGFPLQHNSDVGRVLDRSRN
mmetsp:Transcript_5744/g.13493  ORF Transcript_5744/g.13493 Transcript_5744/m.13493 type:complete len:223 (+) Transcript_5744:1197-1865(+)